MTIAQLLRNHVTFEARHSDQARGPTITAVLDEGPLHGTRIEAQVVEGRPPSTVDVPADDSSTCCYCLAEWAQSGHSATTTFLFRVESSHGCGGLRHALRAPAWDEGRVSG